MTPWKVTLSLSEREIRSPKGLKVNSHQRSLWATDNDDMPNPNGVESKGVSNSHSIPSGLLRKFYPYPEWYSGVFFASVDSRSSEKAEAILI